MGVPLTQAVRTCSPDCVARGSFVDGAIVVALWIKSSSLLCVNLNAEIVMACTAINMDYGVYCNQYGRDKLSKSSNRGSPPYI